MWGGGQISRDKFLTQRNAETGAGVKDSSYWLQFELVFVRSNTIYLAK